MNSTRPTDKAELVAYLKHHPWLMRYHQEDREGELLLFWRIERNVLHFLGRNWRVVCQVLSFDDQPDREKEFEFSEEGFTTSMLGVELMYHYADPPI